MSQNQIAWVAWHKIISASRLLETGDIFLGGTLLTVCHLAMNPMSKAITTRIDGSGIEVSFELQAVVL